MLWTLIDVYRQILNRNGEVIATEKIRSQWYKVSEVPKSTPETIYSLTMRYQLCVKGVNPNETREEMDEGTEGKSSSDKGKE